MRFFYILLLLILAEKSNAQCIQNFPHLQNFENSTGNWVTGGLASDWEWGTPAKNIINSSPNGTKCWNAGTLIGNFYTLGQRSFIESPCFDFTLLKSPSVTFDIFWETENQYDGCVFQSSINNGLTWENVGSFGETPNCFLQNWYNQNNISGLNTLANVKEGWGGTSLPTSGSCQGGNGSNGWKKATHCIANLAGNATVKFRFAFGAGTLCNNFNGFAMDNFQLEENKLNADVDFSCTQNAFEYQFTSTVLPCVSNYSWTFFDNNNNIVSSSNIANPVVKFNLPGNYNIQFIASQNCAISDTVIKELKTIQPNTIGKTPNCVGDNTGSIEVTNSGYNPSIFSINPPTTYTAPNFNNLKAGTYTITIIDSLQCQLTFELTFFDHPEMIWQNVTATSPKCAGEIDGEIKVDVQSFNPGTIEFENKNTGEKNTTGIFQNLKSGSYEIIATDAKNCTSNTIVFISTGPCCEEIFIPNAFSPNDDLKNDFFEIFSTKGVELLSTKLFTRWGEIFVDTDNPIYSWDGKIKGIEAPVGTYFYLIKYKCLATNEIVEAKGDINLIR